MKVLVIALIFSFGQSSVTIVKNNGEEIVLSDVLFYQTEAQSSPEKILYTFRGKSSSIPVNQVKRISFKETIRKKKGITTYRVVLVKRNNDKIEVEVDLVRLEGKDGNGKKQQLGLGSVDKISF